MGTTLTGTTPQDTYDSLIKVTDNGPISGTLKALSDGLGNDSTLSLSTTAASIAGTLAVTGNATFDTDTLFVDAANNRVGIGTTSPDTALDVNGGSKFRGSISGFSGAEILLNAGSNSQVAISTNGAGTTEMYFDQRGTATGIWRFRDTTDTRMSLTNVGLGIGTTAPAVPLDVVGNIRSSTGILFGTDIAAGNALDDYEEGTWTMGLSFGGGDTGITYTFRTGNYTKIGRQVNVTGWVRLSSKGSSTGVARLTGLPFTNGAASEFYTSVTLGYIDNISFADIPNGYVQVGATTINLGQTTNAGTLSDLTNANFINNSTLMINATYFV